MKNLTFGKRMKELRSNHNLSQTELGEKISLSRRMVQYLESGGREPNLATINGLCDIFDCSADYLLGRCEENA